MPECMFLVPEIAQAFPRARYVQLIRDPLKTCLRRTHMTARLDNHIGRVTLPLAYRYSGVDLTTVLQDLPAVHMTHSVRHQVESVTRYCRSTFEGRYLELRFEDALAKPVDTLQVFADWLCVSVVDRKLRDAVDLNRATRPGLTYPPAVVDRVAEMLAPLRRELAYLS